jgi:muramoyltetrapeptide carboxypeptidase
MMSIHGAMPVGLADKSKNTRVYLNDILRGEPQNYRLENKMPLNRDGYAEGELIGGNLSVIYSVIGSSSSLMSDDKILFLEDLDEYLYHLDRMMMSLKRNGIFDKIKGLIIGSFNNMNDNEISFGKSAYEIIFDVVKVYDFPVYFGFPAGHQKDNFPLLFGNHVEMKLNQGQFQLNLKNGCA